MNGTISTASGYSRRTSTTACGSASPEPGMKTSHRAFAITILVVSAAGEFMCTSAGAEQGILAKPLRHATQLNARGNY